MKDFEICRLSAFEMAEAVKTKRLSPVEIVDAVLKRIEKLNPKVNAYCTLAVEAAKRQAVEAEKAMMKGEKLGRLHGVPVSIKDLIFTKDMRTTGGSKIYADFIPEQDAIVVQRLKATGAIIIGKTNTSEFGYTAITDNPLFGPTRNPWNLELTPGGSSGGAAAAVATCMGPIGIGSDSGGSIRIPSSFCSVFGFKPSFGLVPRYPSFPGMDMLAHNGPITRTVRDAALTMEIIAGGDTRDRFCVPGGEYSYLPSLKGSLKGLKVAWSKDLGYAVVDPRVLKVTEAAAKVFATLGCAVEEASPGAVCPDIAYSSYVGVRQGAALHDKLEEWKDRIDPGLLRFIERNRDRSAIVHTVDWFDMLKYREAMLPFFEKYDLLLTPTVAIPPFEVGRFGPREIAGRKVSPIGWMAFSFPFNITGQPAATVPCGWTDDGLPVGLQIVGRNFEDATVLKASAAFEETLPWADKYPPLG